MPKPVLIIVNGLPGTGKTTLAKRLAADIPLPLFSRDGLYETLYNALERQGNANPSSIAPAMYPLLYSIAGTLLAAGQSLIVEGFFGRPRLRTAEFLQLQRNSDFEPLQILCKADGKALLERFYARMGSGERHAGHQDIEWIEQNQQRLLQGRLTPLSLGGPLIEIDTTTPHSFDYADLLQRVQTALQRLLMSPT